MNKDIPYGVVYWHQRRSRNGIPGDALNSMLQKSIRRGEEERALAAAYEMYVTSPDYLDMLWKRLVCIAVEDVGFGDARAVPLIRALNGMRGEFPYADRDQALFFVHAVRYLCRCRKERTSDHLRGMLSRAFTNGYVPQVPDEPEDRTEEEELLRIHADFLEHCRDGAAAPAEGSFRTNTWQY